MVEARPTPDVAILGPRAKVSGVLALLGLAAESLVFASVALPDALGWCLQGAALGVVALTVYLVISIGADQERLLTLLVLFPLFFQNLLIGVWLFPGYDIDHAVALVETKTIVASIAVLAGLGTWHAGKWRWARSYLAPAILLGIWALVSIAWSSESSSMTVLAYLRNLVTPALFATLGIILLRTGHARTNMVAVLDTALWLGMFLTLFSAAEMLLGAETWRDDVLHVGLLELAKGPFSDRTDFLGYMVGRLRSAVGEPVNASYIFVTLTWIAVFRRRVLLAVVLGVQGLLTFGKGGLLVGTFAIAWAAGTYAIRANRRLAFKAVLLLSSTFGLFSAYSLLSAGGDGPTTAQVLADPDRYYLGHNTALTHAGGLSFGLRALASNPLGSGLGSGGNFGNIFGELDPKTWITSGAESAIGVVMHQLGLVGLLLVVLLFGAVLRRAFTLQRQNDRFGSSMAGLTIGFIAASLFQENAFGPQAGGLFFILVGLLMALPAKEKRHGRAT